MDAKIIEIKSQGSRSGDYIVLGIDNKPINPELPLWQQTDNDTNKPGKIIVRPTAFLVNQPQTAALLMTVRIFSHPIDDDFFLECLYGAGKVRLLYGLPLERNLERREIVFQVKWLYTPGGFFKMTGKELAWRLSWAGGNEFKELGSVDLEIYWLYGNPYDYFPKGIPVETLREIARVLLLSKVFGGHGTFFQKGPVPPEAKIVEQVVNHCFKRNPPRFNTWRGASQFTIPGSQFAGTLLINQYLHSKNDRNALCNCMDQAGVLEYYLKVIGIEEVVVYSLDRFGFLNNVQLVGRGVCNNPYYGAAQGCAREKAVVDKNCQDRTFFNNHIFCLWKNNGEWRILDSCIGPFTGGDNKTQYLEKARNANKWPKGDRTKVAWPEDIILPGEPVPRGVCPPGRITFTINQLPGEVEDFFPFAGQDLALRPKGVTWEPPRFLVREWPDIARLQIPGKKGWRLLYKRVPLPFIFIFHISI